MRRVSARWLLAIMLSAFFASLLTVGQGTFIGEAAESQAVSESVLPLVAAPDLPSTEEASACDAASCCDKPTAEQLAEIEQIKRAVGINPFEGTLLSAVEPEVSSPENDAASLGSAPDGKDVGSLREAAHQLERVAHELELRNLYTHADEIRQLAARMRTEAREMFADTIRR